MEALRKMIAGLGFLSLSLLLTACPGSIHKPGIRGFTDWYALYGHNGSKSRMLGTADIPVGSMWTDGQYCYMVTSVDGGLIRMEGGTLHEGGGICALAVENDSTMRVAMPSEGYTTFAEEGLMVTHQLLTAEVDSTTTRNIEVLIAYKQGNVPYKDPYAPEIDLTMQIENIIESDTSEEVEIEVQQLDSTAMRYPVAVLQRLGTAKSHNQEEAYDEMLEQELAFELADIHTALTGTYASDPTAEKPNRQWTFFPDGKVQTAPDIEPLPYGIELAYHSPTDVIRMPDGTRYVILYRKTGIYFSEAVYDEEEEIWKSKNDEHFFDFKLSNEDYYISRLWTYTRILTPAMLTVMDTDIKSLAQLYKNLEDAKNPIGLLNYYLLLQMAWESEKEE